MERSLAQRRFRIVRGESWCRSFSSRMVIIKNSYSLGYNYLTKILDQRRMLDQFVISTSQQALALDSLLTSHPINTSVANPADIEETFDLISYKKVLDLKII